MKKVGVLSIGDELMSGFTIDTNSTWIAQKISYYESLFVKSKITVCDSEASIHEYLKYYIDKKYDYIIITGGLGPTHDDITKRAIANFFNLKLIIQSTYYDKLRSIFRAKHSECDLKHLKSQAEIIKGSHAIGNKQGTALGMHLNIKNINFYVFPGVPKEMKLMMNSYLIPYLDETYKDKRDIKTILTAGVYESKLSKILNSIIIANKMKYKFSFLPNYNGVKVRIDKIDKSIESKIFSNFISQVVNEIDKYVYGFDNDKIENHVVDLLIKNKIKLAVAESCTGGGISKLITNVPGCSDIFNGSIIAYNNMIKIKSLGIDSNFLKKNGAVNPEVALKMARNIRKKYNADIGVSTTGISGPGGGSENKPIGLIYIGISYGNNKNTVKRFDLISNRKQHQEIASNIALNMIRILLKNKTFDLK